MAGRDLPMPAANASPASAPRVRGPGFARRLLAHDRAARELLPRAHRHRRLRVVERDQGAPRSHLRELRRRPSHSEGWGRSFFNSLIITVPSSALVIFVAALAAYAFAWMDFPGRNVLFLLMVGLLVVPLQMTLIPLLQLYTNVTIDADLPLIGGNLFGTSRHPGIWLAHTGFGLPFAVFLLRNFFGSLPRDLFEAACIDGASDLQVFFRIALPLATPAIASLAIFQFLWVWNDLLVALIFLGDPDLAPMTLKITNLVSSFGTNYEVLTAGGLRFDVRAADDLLRPPAILRAGPAGGLGKGVGRPPPRRWGRLIAAPNA